MNNVFEPMTIIPSGSKGFSFRFRSLGIRYHRDRLSKHPLKVERDDRRLENLKTADEWSTDSSDPKMLWIGQNPI